MTKEQIIQIEALTRSILASLGVQSVVIETITLIAQLAELSEASISKLIQGINEAKNGTLTDATFKALQNDDDQARAALVAAIESAKLKQKT
jgi:hypothetical protein